jgi:hypothetical protein
MYYFETFFLNLRHVHDYLPLLPLAKKDIGLVL